MNHCKLSSIARAALAASTLALCGAGQAAALANGDFSAGFTAWSTAGNIAVDASSTYGPPPGGLAAQAVMGTGESTGFLFGGAVAGAAALDSFTGMAAGSMAAIGGIVGSAIAQKFDTLAGQSLVFNWKMMTNDPQNSPSNDTAFLVIDGVMTKLATVQTAVLLGSSPSPLLDETAYAKFTSAPLGAGSHLVSFGIIDVPDSLGASVLAVSGVAVAAVPEPGSWALLLAGAAVVGGIARRRQLRA